MLDITTDLNIPSFAAISKKTGCDTEAITLGFGAHFDPQVAMLRAVTEAGQLFPSDTAKKEDPWEDPDAIEWWHNATVVKHPYLLPDPQQRFRKSQDYDEWRTDDFCEDVAHCVEIARLDHLGDLAMLKQESELNPVHLFL